MKKIVTVCLLLAFVGGMAFAQEEGDGNQKMVNIQVGAGIMYMYFMNANAFTFYAFRGGVQADLLFSLGMFELGAEVGVYVMDIEILYTSVFIFEIPLDALVRINFSKDRSFAMELRAGGWLEAATAGGASAGVFGFNVGARLVANVFYLGVDYVSLAPGAIVPEVGVKFSF